MPEAPTFDELIRRVRGGRPGRRGRAGPDLRAGDPPRRPLPPDRRAARQPPRLDGHLPVGPAELLRPRRLGPVRAGDARAAPDAAGDDGPQQARLAGAAQHAGRRDRRRDDGGRDEGARFVARGPGPSEEVAARDLLQEVRTPALADDERRLLELRNEGATGRRSPRSSAARPRPCARSSPAPSTASPRSSAWTTSHDRPPATRSSRGDGPADPSPTGPCWRSCWRTSGAHGGAASRPAVEAYLGGHPALRADAEAVLDLIYNEILLREEAGESPRLEDYVGAVPGAGPQLALQFEVERALGPARERHGRGARSRRRAPPSPAIAAGPVRLPGLRGPGGAGPGRHGRRLQGPRRSGSTASSR